MNKVKFTILILFLSSLLFAQDNDIPNEVKEKMGGKSIVSPSNLKSEIKTVQFATTNYNTSLENANTAYKKSVLSAKKQYLNRLEMVIKALLNRNKEQESLNLRKEAKKIRSEIEQIEHGGIQTKEEFIAYLKRNNAISYIWDATKSELVKVGFLKKGTSFKYYISGKYTFDINKTKPATVNNYHKVEFIVRYVGKNQDPVHSLVTKETGEFTATEDLILYFGKEDHRTDDNAGKLQLYIWQE
jgi:hypothetical protein